ncbi:hypothetical protein FA09DRAFT_338618 [Tilletiopsis washingtonensis]|uniref:CRAL-TRIO domain-containing protein n=1 Tax=Tilletiopsis washingtonensis TaxID=58919 RepID=A0A316Z8S8_9BASI|nr:hypothetical protein FA09DRAFT_338618 [Tilletiopsis washingtonensis]PWN98190.1 hypothetical protein FA09DRAFT_338618 [Tilletiopsis washingtonensis]
MSTKKNLDGEDVLPGYVGNLEPDQQKALREIWRRFFELYEKNPERSAELDKKGGPNSVSDKDSAPPPKDEKQAGKDIPKDDKAKEEAKKQEEMKEMNQFIDTYGGPYLRRALWEFIKHDGPDAGMLRFLRARKWDVDRALAMLAAALKFRFEKDVEGIIQKGEQGLEGVPGFLNQFRRGISYIKGNSEYPGEHPVYFIHVARHFTNAQKHEVLQQFVLLAMENARQLTTPPYEKAVVIFDLGGFGLKNMDWQCVLFLVKCLEAYYPESLQRIYVHSAPWIFKGIWQVLQPMLDPVVRDKIKFSSKAADLKDYATTEKLRKGMGGTMEWDWDYTEPDPKENDLMKDTKTVDAMKKEYDDLAKEFEETTRKWFEKSDTDDGAKDLSHRRWVLTKQLRLKALQMSKYTRAVNVYQRTGILKDDCSFTWEYPQADGSVKKQTVNERHNIPALKKWLKEQGEDTLEDSVAGRLGFCGTEADGGEGESSVAAKAGGEKPKRKPTQKSDAEKGGAAAGGAAAGGGALGGLKSLKNKVAKKDEPAPEPEPEPEPEPQQESESEDEEPAQQQTRAPQNGGGEEPQQQSYTGAALGAIGGAAAAVTGAAGGAAAYITGRGQQQEEAGDASQQHRGQQQDDDEEEDEDDEYQEDEGSDFSDDSITPETAIAPTYIPRSSLSSSAVKIDDNDCREDLAIVREAMNLFLNSRMKEAEELCQKDADHRLYKAVGMSLINTVKAIMTFEPADLETAIMCCKHSMNIASLLRKKAGPLGKLTGKGNMYKNMTLVQQHAELVFAESQLLKAVLGIFYAGDGLAFVKNALGLRNSYLLMRELLKFVEYCDGEAEEAQIHGRRAATSIDQDFRSGVYMSNATCSLILSMLPAKALKMMEGLGFSGDRRLALDLYARAGGWTKSRPLPTISADEEGVRRPLCDIGILLYHLIISSYIPVTDVDFEFADKVLSWNLVRYPNGIFFLYFSARLYAAQALPEKAIEYFRNAIEAQREYKQLHHLCFWDLSLTYLATCDFARCFECQDVLSRESNWSKAIYQYAKAVMLYESGMDDRAKSATIMRTVGKLTKKIAGRQIPFERFCAMKARKYIANNNRLPLAGIEFSYLWHCIGQTPVFLLVENTLSRIDSEIDELESFSDPRAYGSGENEYWSAVCLAYFLRGVALRNVAFPEPHTLVRLPSEDSIGPLEEITQDCKQSFEKVFEHASKLDETDRYLCYFAHYELGRLLSAMGREEEAKKEIKKVLSGKPLEAKGKGAINPKASYLLSGMCTIRAHAALETMRITRSRSRGTFYSGSEAGTLASGSSIGGSLSSRNSMMSSTTSRSGVSRNTSVSSRSDAAPPLKVRPRSTSGNTGTSDYGK